MPSLELFILDGVDQPGAMRTMIHCLNKMPDRFWQRASLSNEVTKDDLNPEKSWQRYCEFVLMDLVHHVTCDFVMIAHRDGYILNSPLWDHRFLDYDYIGAPWEDGTVGNGGFCIRSRRFMLWIAARAIERPLDRPEDQFICHGLRATAEEAGFTFAPTELAARFSTEGPPGSSPENSFGFHGHIGSHPLRKLL